MKKEHDAAHHMRLAGRIRFLVFGSAHGLVSLMALIAGLVSGGVNSNTIFIIGLIGVIAGAVTLVSVEYLSSKSQKDFVKSFLKHERREFKEDPEHEIQEMRNYYLKAGFNKKETQSLINRITSTKSRWLEAHATHILNISPKKLGSPLKDALQLMKYHIIGGMVPILPFLFLPVTTAFIVSLVISAIALFALGVLKNKEHPVRSGLEMFTIVMLAVLVSYLLGALIHRSIG